jgi:hypothetical protein
MLRNTTAFLAIILLLGSSALSTSAFAYSGRDRGYGAGGRGRDGFPRDHFAGGFGGRIAGGTHGGHAGRLGGLGSEFRGYRHGDAWGHWGAYYGPMIPPI